MRPHRNLERLIGAALVDRVLQEDLLHSPVEVGVGFGLSEEELAVLGSAHASSLEELAAHVHGWIARAPKPRRTPVVSRWALDGYDLARVAV